MDTFETDQIENKLVSQDSLPNDLWEPITAFSNMDGGIIYLGVDNDGNRIGIKPDYIDKIQGDIVSLTNSAFNHKIYPIISISEDNVISVYIPPLPASLRPLFSVRRGLPKGAKVRVGSSNMQVDEEWIKRFAMAAQGGAELCEYPIKYTDIIDSDLVEERREKIKDRRKIDVYNDLTLEQILIKERAITKEDTVTLFGLLAYSINDKLQETTSPSLNIAITQYVGTSKADIDATKVSIDDREFNGNTYKQFNDSFSYLLSKLPIKSEIGAEGKRIEYFAIPALAIETLANAIVHRDYSNHRGKIQIDIYSDRIEFANPGRSLIPLEHLDNTYSETRNPLLMNFLRDFKVTEHRARGIKNIKSSLREAGLAEPKFEHRNDWFVATIYNSAFVREDDQEWLSRFKSLELNERQHRALVHLRNSPEGINNSEYRDINSMHNVGDDVRAKKELKKMVDFELLDIEGEKGIGGI